MQFFFYTPPFIVSQFLWSGVWVQHSWVSWPLSRWQSRMSARWPSPSGRHLQADSWGSWQGLVPHWSRHLRPRSFDPGLSPSRPTGLSTGQLTPACQWKVTEKVKVPAEWTPGSETWSPGHLKGHPVTFCLPLTFKRLPGVCGGMWWLG